MKVRDLLNIIASRGLSGDSEVRVQNHYYGGKPETYMVERADPLNLRQWDDPRPEESFLVLTINLDITDPNDLAAVRRKA